MQDNYGCTEYILPRTLEKLGGCAFAWGPPKRVFYFMGDVSEVEITNNIGTGTNGADQALYAGYNNYQYVYCVDAKTYPCWKTHASTMLYTEENPSLESETSWIPEAVRYGVAYGFAKSFGNSSLCRGCDTSANGRAYMIHKSSVSGMIIILR